MALSWARVPDETARRLLLLAGHCAPNAVIPGELLAAAAGLEDRAGNAALAELAGLGLVRWTADAAGPTLHPLVAEYAQGQAGAAALLPALADALVERANAANETDLPARGAPLCPHLARVAAAAEQAGLADVGTLWGNLGYYLHLSADYAGARAACERALEIWERALGPEHPDVATASNNLGRVLQALGDYAGARAACERALQIDERALGPDHPTVATNVNNLGNVLHALGPAHPRVATDVNSLGRGRQDLGDRAGARAAYERALAIRERVLPPEHPSIRTVRKNLEALDQDCPKRRNV